MFTRKIFAAVSLGIVAVSAVPAAAQTSVAVQTGDIELSTEAGQRTLDNRLNNAVREICGTRFNNRSLRDIVDHQSCVAGAEQSFKEQRRIAISNAQSPERMAVTAPRSSTAG